MKTLIRIYLILSLGIIGFTLYQLSNCYLILKYKASEVDLVGNPFNVIQSLANDFICYLYTAIIYIIISVFLGIVILYKSKKMIYLEKSN